MINQRQLYDAFRACKQIYGIDRVHVNLIAIQLGVLAIDVITYINNNPTLVNTRFEAANSGFVKPETANYPGVYVTDVASIPFISTVSVPKVGEDGATIVLTLSGDTFAAAAGTIANFTVDAGTTGLTLSTSTKDSDTQATLVFTGTIDVGTLSIRATATALTGTVASDIVYLDMVDPTFTASTLTKVNADIVALESAVGAYAGEDDIASDLAALQALNVITTTTLDLSSTNGSPAALPVTYSHVIVTANPESNPGEIALPVSTGSGLKVTVIHAPSITTGIVFQPNDTDTINGENDTFLVPSKSSVTLIDISEGEWLLI
ncbi:MAG: hypothetical protein RBT65_09805 [Methanolobus sp.]|nr:hypothetical protein [Methanolobus sp.]